MNRKHYICRKMFLRILWPSLISSVALAIADVADALVIGNRMGESGLAAIGIVTPLYMILNLMGYGFSIGGCVTYSRLAAEGREEEALSHFRTIGTVLFILGVILAGAGALLMKPLLTLLGAGNGGAELYTLCEEYAVPLVIAVPVFFLNFLLYDFVRCDNDAPRATLGFSVGCITDLALNILFVLVLGLGVKGSIWATVIAQTVSVIILGTHLINGRGLMSIPRVMKAKLRLDKSVWSSLRIGFSSSIRYVFQFLFLLLGNRMLLRAGELGLIKGDLYVAVFDVVMNISYIFLGIYQAFADTMQPLASTFAAEHGKDDLKYLARLAMATGLMVGIPAVIVAALLAGPLSSFFGLSDGESLKVAIPAIRLYCVSTPLGGLLVILTGFFQSCGREKLAGMITIMRKAIFLLPATVLLGMWLPQDFWWLFLIAESLTMVMMLTAVRGRLMKEDRNEEVPVFTATMDNQNHELPKVLDDVVAFCEKQEIPMKQAILIQLAVEELSVVTMDQAFSGKPDEYIQLTLAKEENDDYVLHIRNSAPYFNPLDLRMGKIQRDETEDLMDSVGVMMVRQKVKALHYRNYEGFNMMTVVI